MDGQVAEEEERRGEEEEEDKESQGLPQTCHQRRSRWVV